MGGFSAQFYNGIENILKRIHKFFKLDLPKGDDWHSILLERFSLESEFIIPVKLSKKLIDDFNDLRRFRHYFYHGYGHNLNWEILSNGVKDIQSTLDNFIFEIRDNGIMI